MRIRFSLRTLFILVTSFAVFCYVWFIRPAHVAQRFADAINSEDYKAADRLFLRPRQQFLVDWADKHWGFAVHCEPRPLTFAQLLAAARQVDVHTSYFELDCMVSRKDDFIATPFGIESGASVEISTSRLIDRAQNPTPIQK